MKNPGIPIQKVYVLSLPLLKSEVCGRVRWTFNDVLNEITV
jgi:hypothetical protein